MEPGLAVVKLDIRTDDYECRLRVDLGPSRPDEPFRLPDRPESAVDLGHSENERNLCYFRPVGALKLLPMRYLFLTQFGALFVSN